MSQFVPRLSRHFSIVSLAYACLSLGSLTSALALKQSGHYNVTYEACRAEKFGMAYCKAVAAAAYNVDKLEWTDMAAHGQRRQGQSACDAGQATANRLNDLGRAIRATNTPKESAKLLGQALHTIQDECAHHGMTNAQHAHFSLDAECGDGTNPDTTSSALSCAASRTKAAFVALRGSLGLSSAELSSWCVSHGCSTTRMVGLREGCEFLGERAAWNFKETKWTNAAGQIMFTAFTNGLTGGGAPKVCGNGDIALAADTLAKEPAESCTTVRTVCGKVDASEEELVEVFDEDANNIVEETEDGGGCSVVQNNGGLVMLGLLGIGLSLSRPRRGVRRA